MPFHTSSVLRPQTRRRLAGWPFALLCVALAVSACTFDRSGLSNKSDCNENDDCPRGYVCHDGFCASELNRNGDVGDVGRVDGVVFDAEDGAADPTVTDETDRGPVDGGTDSSDDTGCPALNACGGCDTLDHEPGSACGGGECGTGTWECAAENVVECRSEDVTLNLCGGCEALDDSPGDECGDCGVYECADDGDSLECDDPGTNACDGCENLEHEPDADCGVCLDGDWACNDEGGIDCVDATPANACGGCGDLIAPPLAECGVCLDGTYQCNYDNTAVTCIDATPANTCGGCGVLAGAPTTDCGDCLDGTWTCNGDGSAVTCEDASAFNACGGCGGLVHQPETECGVCLDGLWTCNHDGSLVSCEDASDYNLCGGCGVLAGAPTTDCGICLDGTWTCNGDGSAVTCENPSELNACGGCGVLAHAPTTTCGDCSLGTWTCTALKDAVECLNDPGFNVCGGCEVLPGSPDEQCTCGGAGDATYYCSGTALLCGDSDNSAASATGLAGVNEEQTRDASGWLDSAADGDWYSISVSDVNWVFIEPELTVSTPTPAGISVQACVFYRWNGDRRIAGYYGCGNSDQCSYYDASAGTITTSNCRTVDGFDNNHDLYGCCETDLGHDVENKWRVFLNGVDGIGNQSGVTYAYVKATSNTDPEGCASYDLHFSF